MLLRVGPNADGSGARDASAVPVPNDSRLRNLAWIEENRRKVDQLSNGRVAYVYMPDTAFGGLTYFTRYFYAQVGKEAAIIDERFNGGGLLATDIIELLSRKRMSAVSTRDGEDEVQPQGAIFGPKVMLINEFAGSGGDAMPTYFRRANVGKLVGKRTWGGLIGRAGAPLLLLRPIPRQSRQRDQQMQIVRRVRLRSDCRQQPVAQPGIVRLQHGINPHQLPVDG